MNRFLVIPISLLFVSCATVEKSTILGGFIGGTAGALIGNAAGSDGHRDTSTAIGAAVGLGIGALIGYNGYKDKEKKDHAKLLQQTPFDTKAPLLTAPKVRRVWVPAKIEGEKYIDGHYMYVIEKISGWSE